MWDSIFNFWMCHRFISLAGVGTNLFHEGPVWLQVLNKQEHRWSAVWGHMEFRCAVIVWSENLQLHQPKLNAHSWHLNEGRTIFVIPTSLPHLFNRIVLSVVLNAAARSSKLSSLHCLYQRAVKNTPILSLLVLIKSSASGSWIRSWMPEELLSGFQV